MHHSDPAHSKYCGCELTPSQIKEKHYACVFCRNERRFQTCARDEYINKAFSKDWTANLFRRLCAFLVENNVSLQSKARMLPKVTLLLQEAEQRFSGLHELEEEWLEGRIQVLLPSKQNAPTFFKLFLAKEQIILPQGDKTTVEKMRAKIAKFPSCYQRVVEVYLNERLAVRERHMTLKAKKPLSFLTIEADMDLYLRATRWLVENMPDLAGWKMVQEEHIYAFLLTVPLASREIARNDLLQLFRLARKRRLITHVPITNQPARKWPSTIEALKREEQKSVAQLIRGSITTHPIEAFLTALCFYHGLSSSEILHIKTSDVDIDRGQISIDGRPPVYLLTEDLLLLEQFLHKRKEMPYAQMKSYLFLSNIHRLDDKPVDISVLTRKIQNFTKYTPRQLRISCFTALSERYGPQYLVEAFGLSLAQASNYGKFEEYLLEEEVKQQREAFVEMSNHL